MNLGKLGKSQGKSNKVAKLYWRKWDSKKYFVITKPKLGSWKLIDKAKKKKKKEKKEYDSSFLLKLEDLKEQVKFLENEKLAEKTTG